jgi:type VI secretion system protein ImpJ
MGSNPAHHSSSALMKHLSKVVWFEGMYLGPHHFQVQRQSFEDLVHFSCSNLWFEPFGLIGYQLDAEALRNGMVALVHARGIFPDGLVFQMKDSDPLPEARRIDASFPPTRESLKVMLAVPAHKQDGPNCTFALLGSDTDTRYIAEEHPLCDENTGTDPRSVHLGRKNVRYVFENESSEGLSVLPIARIMRDGAGHFIYDPSFIPPCLQIRASERLMMILYRLIDILDEKSATLAPSRRGASRFQAGFSSGEVASFWFVHTVNSNLTVLRHLCKTERGHPEQVYAEMSRLGGALCTFGMGSHPETLPAYDHLNLDKCFHALDEHIRRHLEFVVPTNCIVIPLEPAGRYICEGEISDQRCLDRARWILAMQSNVGEADLISRAPRQVKICSAELLPELVKTALPGLGLTHLPVPPSAIAPKVDFQYFGISRTGSCWEHIVQTRKVGVYVPGDFPNTKLELLIILES